VNPDRTTEGLGCPDWTLEVVSPSSETKDLKELIRDYAAAGVEEYWIADARREDPVLRILVLKRGRYREPKPDADSWIASPFWGRSFRLVRFTKRTGLTDFRLEARPSAKR
jgi:Uma2 family endonuclease